MDPVEDEATFRPSNGGTSITYKLYGRTITRVLVWEDNLVPSVFPSLKLDEASASREFNRVVGGLRRSSKWIEITL